jgi:hexosaminidase
MQKITILTTLLFLVAFAKITAQDIVPKPSSFIRNEGFFEINSNISIDFDKKNQDLSALSTYFQKYIATISEHHLAANKKANRRIKISFLPQNEAPNETYSLNITPNEIDIKATSKAGIFYAFQSIFQLLPSVTRTNFALKIPCCSIEDTPRFAWRGMHLDVSRHFFSIDFIKEYLDLMAKYKMNVFHWHLTDDQGWRLEIKKYPKLTSVAAWRADRRDKTWREKEPALKGEAATYGGFYTQAQIKEIVAYATERNIQVLPEIEMPGHSMAAIAAYPEYSCEGTPVEVQTGGQYRYYPSFCAGKDSVFLFLQDVLTEVIALFPSQYIHVGGDELDKVHWKKCAHCQQRIKAERLKDEDELQSYFMGRISTFLQKKGKKMIGWDEILEGGLTSGATVMSWRGESGGIAAAQMGHDVIMTPGSHCYFDHYQADPASEPLAIGGFTTLKKVYHYEPIPSVLTAEQAKLVKGAEGTLWTEFIPSVNQAEYMLLPRLLALSEVLWTKSNEKDWKSFRKRLDKHFFDFEQQGINYCKGNYKLDITPRFDDGKISATLATEDENVTVYYTLDGTEPSPLSEKYEGKPIAIDHTLLLRAAVFKDGKSMNWKAEELPFDFHLATAKKVTYNVPFNTRYAANQQLTLTDGIRGSKNHTTNWHGFSGENLDIVIDLEDTKTIQQITVGALQNYKSWIFFPEKIRFESSEDGQKYTLIGESENTTSMQEKTVLIKDFTIKHVAPIRARYLKVTGINPKACPQGHPGEGKSPWIFFDEVMVK